MNKKILISAALVLLIATSVFGKDETGRPAAKKELIFPFGVISDSHAPNIVELPDGELFAVWYAAKPRDPSAAIWGSRKPHGADEWDKPWIINYVSDHSNKNPVLYLNKDNKLLLFWTEEARWYKWKIDVVRMKTSDDMGRTWSKPRDISPSGFLTRNHPIRLNDGRIILPIYTDWSTSSAVITSTDGGLTWTRPDYILFLLGIQPTIIQRSDSSLYTIMRTGTWPRLAWEAESYNMGKTWKNQKLSSVKNPGSSLEMLKLRNGHVVLIFNDSKTTREGLSLALSYDDGKTWSHTRAIEYDEDSVNCYPSIMQDRDGLIHVVYAHDNRRSIAHFVTDEDWIAGKK